MIEPTDPHVPRSHARAARGVRISVCLGAATVIAAGAGALAGAGCKFSPPGATSDGPIDPPGDGPEDAPDGPPDARPDATPDAMPDGPLVPACVNDPTYMLRPGTDHRYKRVAESLDYDSAVQRCAMDGAHLAAIDDMGENTFVRSLGGGAGEIWIGFDDLTVEGAFRWVNGSASTFTRWNTGEPNNAGAEDCTYMLPGNDRWNDTSCSETRQPVCECDPGHVAPPIPMCRTLPSGFELRLGRRFFVSATARTWQQAQDECNAIGAHLMVIGDRDEHDNLDMLFNNRAWLGYTDAVTEGAFIWVNGATSTFTRWPGAGNPPMNNNEDCAALEGNGTWADRACSEMNIYACECDPLPP